MIFKNFSDKLQEIVDEMQDIFILPPNASKIDKDIRESYIVSICAIIISLANLVLMLCTGR